MDDTAVRKNGRVSGEDSSLSDELIHTLVCYEFA